MTLVGVGDASTHFLVILTAANIGGLFEECYSLALTQSRKNKDIPEGGSKGVILLNLAHQDKATVAFKKYVGGCCTALSSKDHPFAHKELVVVSASLLVLFLTPAFLRFLLLPQTRFWT